MKSGAVATLRFLFFIQKVFQHIDVGGIGGEVDLGLLVVWQALLRCVGFAIQHDILSGFSIRQHFRCEQFSSDAE